MVLSLCSSDVVQVSCPAVLKPPIHCEGPGEGVWGEGVSCPARSASLHGQPGQGWEGAGVAVDLCSRGWGGCLREQQQSTFKPSHNTPSGCRAQPITGDQVSSPELVVAIRIVISEPFLVPGTILGICHLTNTINHAESTICCIDSPWPCFDKQVLPGCVAIAKVVHRLKFSFAESSCRNIPGINLDCDRVRL